MRQDRVTTAVWLLVFCAAMPGASLAQTFNTLTSFNGTNGGNPEGALLQGADGNFYGTTWCGGTHGICNPNGPSDGGTAFKVTPAGKLTTLYDFCAQNNCTDGFFVAAGLTLATDGNFYGTTDYGGADISGCNGFGCGTVFKITPKGHLTTLHSFDGNDDGSGPGGLVQADDGTLYGTTYTGGPNGGGTFFRITRSGALTTLHSFCFGGGCGTGFNPTGNLLQALDGKFYGTTQYGGTHGGGTIFRITREGKLSTLYSFCSQTNCSDGETPSGVTQGSDGNFYGTTTQGGTNYAGTIFKITPAGKLSTLYSFCQQSNCSDGSNPNGLMQATDGNFYGTTYYGPGNNPLAGPGTVFKISRSGKLTTLYRFCSVTNCADGSNPFATPFQGTNGPLYGTTMFGGTNNSQCAFPYFGPCGTLYSLSVSLGSFIETNPTSGKVGTKVIVLGNNLKGTTKVAFNGTVATFAVVSNTEIKTVVPAGATSGYVAVTTPKKKLRSNVVFRITK